MSIQSSEFTRWSVYADNVSRIEIRELGRDYDCAARQSFNRYKTASAVVDSDDGFVVILNCAPQVFICPHDDKVGSRAGPFSADRLQADNRSCMFFQSATQSGGAK